MFEQLAYLCKKIKIHKLENHEKPHTYPTALKAIPECNVPSLVNKNIFISWSEHNSIWFMNSIPHHSY